MANTALFLVLVFVGTTWAQSVSGTTTIINYCSWTVYTDMKGNGASLNYAVADQTACAKKCRELPVCVAMDYDTVAKVCWIHTTLPAPVAAPNINHIVFTSCDGVATPCLSATWDISFNTGPKNLASTTHTKLAGVTTAADCQKQCLRLADCRAAAYVDSGTDRCFVYIGKVSDFKANTGPLTGYTLYAVRNRCPFTACSYPPLFQKWANTASYPGTASLTSFNELDCTNECLYNQACAGFDYKPDAVAPNTYCWLYTSSTDMVNNMRKVFGSEPTVHQKRLTRCPTSAQPTCVDYEVSDMQNTHGSPGLPYPGLTTPDSCEQGCVDTPWCYGFDWDNSASATTRCWFFTTSDEFTLLQRFKAQVTHTKVENRCLTTTVPPPQTCQAAQWCNSETGNGYYVGNNLPQVTSLTQCQDECVMDDRCISIDYSETAATGKKCYILYVESGKYTNNAVVHIKLKEGCPLTPPPVCTGTTFQEYTSTSSIGGIAVSTINTLDACKAECARRVNGCQKCVKIDFNPSAVAPAAKCYIHEAASTRIPNSGTTQYDLTNACVTGTSLYIGNCQYTETKQRADFGSQVATANTKEMCMQSCSDSPTCRAVEFGPLGCWSHNQPTFTNLRDDSTISFYTKGQCGVTPTPALTTTTTTTTTPTPTPTPLSTSTTQTPFITTSPTCPSWQCYADTGSSGASPLGAMTKAACQAACVADPNCKAIDYDSTCWIFGQTYVPPITTGNRKNVEECVLTRCPIPACTANKAVWTDYFRKNIPGGGRFLKNTASEKECKDECFALAACTGVDMVTIQGSTHIACWVIEKAVTVADQADNTDSVHADLTTRCPTTCTYSFYKAVKMGGANQEILTDNTEAGCVNACKAKGSASCKVAEWYQSQLQCWLHNAYITRDRLIVDTTAVLLVPNIC